MGVLNLSWRDAIAVSCIKSKFSVTERAAGWPAAMTPDQLAALQRPWTLGDRAGRAHSDALRDELVAACGRGKPPSMATTQATPPPPRRRAEQDADGWGSREWADRGFGTSDRPAVAVKTTSKAVTTYYATAADFAGWLVAQGERPSEHVAGWFAAVGVSADAGAATPQPAEPVASESKEDRQDRRLQLCLDAGLEMPNSAVGRMPYGIGKVAEQEGVTRQTFTDDVKAALARKIERERPKPMLVPKRR